MLKNKLMTKIKEYILKKNLCEELYIYKSFKVEFLAQGEYNINYTVSDKHKKYVFRVNTGSQLYLDDQITYEYNALKTLEISGVTPKVFFVDGSKDFFEYGILIMEFLYGRILKYDTDLEKSAKIFGTIHTIDTTNMNNQFIIEDNLCSNRVVESKRLLKDYLSSPSVDNERKDFFNKFLEWAELNNHRDKYFLQNKWHVVNNTEVNSGNFIIGHDKSYLIDWEKPVISDPCQDITQFLAPTTTLWKGKYILSKDEISSFYNTYISSMNGGDRSIIERVQLYNPYLYLRALSWCAYAWLEYQNPDKDIRNLDTLNTINQYLELDFMKKLLKGYMS